MGYLLHRPVPLETHGIRSQKDLERHAQGHRPTSTGDPQPELVQDQSLSAPLADPETEQPQAALPAEHRRQKCHFFADQSFGCAAGARFELHLGF